MIFFFHWRQLWCLKIIKCCNLCFLCWVQIKCSCLFFQISAVNTSLKISSNTGVQIYSERFLLSGYCTCDWRLFDFIFSEDNVKKRWILISNLMCNNHPFQMIFFLNYLFKQSKLTHKKQNIVLPDIYLILIWKRKGWNYYQRKNHKVKLCVKATTTFIIFWDYVLTNFPFTISETVCDCYL